METRKQILQVERDGFGRIFKRICLAHFGKPAIEWGNAQVVVELELLSPSVALRVAYIVRGQPHFWALVQQNSYWYELICRDLEWLQALCPKDDIPSDSRDDWPRLVTWGHEKACTRQTGIIKLRTMVRHILSLSEGCSCFGSCCVLWDVGCFRVSLNPWQ